jgi:type IV pilus assembly protein PilE
MQTTSEKTYQSGFTLVELMITCAIVAILASIAYPSYTQYVYKSRRSDAHAALLRIQQDQEKYRAVNTSYGSSSTTPVLSFSSTSPDGYYSIALSNISGTTYTITATPQNAQSGDSTCSTITLTVSGNTVTYGPSNTCWNK